MGTGNSQIKKDGHLKLILYLDNLSLTHSTFNTSKKCFESIEKKSIENNPLKQTTNISNILQKFSPIQKESHALLAINISQSTFIPEPLFDQKITKIKWEIEIENYSY